MKILLACTFPGKWTPASVLTLCRCSQRAVWGVCAKWNCSRHLILSVIKLSVILLAYITKLSNIYASKLHICIKFYSYYYCRALTSETVALFTFLDVHTFLIEQQTQQFLQDCLLNLTVQTEFRWSLDAVCIKNSVKSRKLQSKITTKQ